MNLVQIKGLLSNPLGKPAILSVIRRQRGEPESVTLNREVVQPPAVEAKLLDGAIAYVKVPFLAQGKALDAKNQVDGLLKKGASSIILDLRASAGGEQSEALELANLFIDSGIITYVQGQKFEKKVFEANSKETLTKAPLVVLINQGTGGAAEIVAGAIADSRRGQLVGVRTFGDGSLQKLIPLDNGWALLISVAKYYTPSGKEIQAVEPQNSGIRPTVEVRAAADEVVDPNADEQAEVQPPAKDVPVPAPDDDKQLKKAIEILKDPTQATKKAA